MVLGAKLYREPRFSLCCTLVTKVYTNFLKWLCFVYPPCSVCIMSHVPGPHDKITTDVVHNSVWADQLAERREKKVDVHLKSSQSWKKRSQQLSALKRGKNDDIYLWTPGTNKMSTQKQLTSLMWRELSVQFKGDLRFSSDWLRAWGDFSRPITGQRKAKIYKKRLRFFFKTHTRITLKCEAECGDQWRESTKSRGSVLRSLWRSANARNVSLLTLYGGQFTFSTQLLTPNYLLYSPTAAAPQFL